MQIFRTLDKWRIFITIYGFFAVLSFYLLNGIWAENSRILYNKFNSSYPIEITQFRLAFDSHLDTSFSLIVGSIDGVILAILIWLGIYWCTKRSNENIAAIFCFSAYSGVLIVASLVVDPSLLFSYINLAYMTFLGLALTFSSYLYVVRCKRKNAVNELKSLFLKKEDYTLKMLELEYNGWRDAIQSFIWVCVIITTGVIIAVLLQWWKITPSEIIFTKEFSKIMVGLVIYGFTLLSGVSIGIVAQMLIIRNEILETIKDLALC